jgi:hypothetical protein
MAHSQTPDSDGQAKTIGLHDCQRSQELVLFHSFTLKFDSHRKEHGLRCIVKEHPHKSPYTLPANGVFRGTDGLQVFEKFGSPSATLQEIEISMRYQRVCKPLIQKSPR